MSRTAPLLVAAALLLPGQHAIANDREHGTFARCAGNARITCVVDGDTIWYRGTKIRLADIDTPEITRPACLYERQLGERATIRLQALLNAGPFTLASSADDEDRYGRKLRVIRRDGRSLGAILIAEGLAQHWQGRRANWCKA